MTPGFKKRGKKKVLSREELESLSVLDLDKVKEILATTWLRFEEVKYLEEEKGIPIRHGRFSAEEEENMKKALNEFLDFTGLTLEDFKNSFVENGPVSDGGLKEKNSRIEKVWPHLGRALPMRWLISIYHHVMRIHHPYNYKGMWTKEEDEHLRRLVQQYGQKWSTIGMKLARMPGSCRDHYRDISQIPNKGTWTVEEEKKLRNAVHVVMGEDRLTQRDAKFSIMWDQVATMVGSRNRNQCRSKWYLYLKESDQPKAWTEENDRELIRMIAESGATDEVEINWCKFFDETPFPWTAPQCQHRYGILKRRLPGYAQMAFYEVIDRLARQHHVFESTESSAVHVRTVEARTFPVV